jgi:hypothetical protein
MEMLYRELAVRDFKPEARSVEVVASTSALDSHGTVLKQNWRLGRFLANPVVLWSHVHGELPLARAEDVRVENGQLVMRLVFATREANPKAEQVMRLLQERVLNAVSVGFVPHDVKLERRTARTSRS